KSKSISKPPPPIVDEYEVGSHLEQLSWAPSPATELPQQGIIPSSLPSTVLLVEDNEEMLDFMAGLLGRHHTVLTAANGREGLETARLKLPDVIVSDIMMPHMNGYEMCQKLKQDPMTRNISVILVTARHGPEAAVQGFSVGADDYVVKPFSSQELVARVGAQTRIRALTTSLIRAEKQTIIGTMSAGIAHEVLNPINAVINGIAPLRGILAEVLSERNHPKQREASIALLEAIETSGRRIHEVVNALLAFARPSENALKLKEAQLSKGVESALTILKFKMKKNTQVHCEYNWDEPILCYPELLNQAVINLIINAIDALPERGGNVWISTEMVDNTVEIRVKDDGPGIPSEYRERIFTPFYTTKPPGLGTGLGLAITQEIVSLHRGEITLLTESDPGTEFIISIPLILHSHEFQDGNADMTMA
ncbi:MAG: hybrid sensor histidine kinase/response regulator, partial [Proteobacteria bacterium]|nr:hybrid sensor histidine kinase/response regulator [Pseudomonadota bacterium]